MMNIGSKQHIREENQNAFEKVKVQSFLMCARMEIAHSEFASSFSFLYWIKTCVCTTFTDGEEKTPRAFTPQSQTTN